MTPLQETAEEPVAATPGSTPTPNPDGGPAAVNKLDIELEDALANAAQLDTEALLAANNLEAVTEQQAAALETARLQKERANNAAAQAWSHARDLLSQVVDRSPVARQVMAGAFPVLLCCWLGLGTVLAGCSTRDLAHDISMEKRARQEVENSAAIVDELQGLRNDLRNNQLVVLGAINENVGRASVAAQKLAARQETTPPAAVDAETLTELQAQQLRLLAKLIDERTKHTGPCQCQVCAPVCCGGTPCPSRREGCPRPIKILPPAILPSQPIEPVPGPLPEPVSEEPPPSQEPPVIDEPAVIEAPPVEAPCQAGRCPFTKPCPSDQPRCQARKPCPTRSWFKRRHF